jgi:hypothetical protein
MGGSATKIAARFRDESGIALAITMMVITIGFALASVGSIAAMSSLRNTARDGGSKEALGVAEAGLQQALLRQNKILVSDAFPCLVLGATQDLIPGYPLPNGWCPRQSGTVGGGTYEYQVKPMTVLGALGGELKVEIVSEGTVNGETRRITTEAYSSTGAPAFADANVIGVESLEFNGSGTITSTAASNSDIVIGSSASLCGDAKHGEGRDLIVNGSGGLCSGYTETEGRLSLSPPDPGNAFTDNDNGRFFTDDTKTGTVTWDSTTRTLSLGGNGALTLGGANYGICRLIMEGNSNIYIADGAVTRIWFDSPENCGLAAGAAQMSMTGNSQISVTSGEAADAGLIFVGSSTTPSSISLSGNGRANELMIYAPLHDIVIGGNGSYTGAIAGKTLVSTGSGSIRADSSVLDFEVGVQTSFLPERFIECTGPFGSGTAAPDAGC